MSKRRKNRNGFPGKPAKLPPPAEVWRIREAGTPARLIARKYGVSDHAVYKSLHNYRIRNGLKPLPFLTLRRYFEGLAEAALGFAGEQA